VIFYSTEQLATLPSFDVSRIISLVPSQTELLFSLGLNEEVIGITKFCVHPNHWHAEKIKIGGTKALHLEKIFELQPTLIIANKEENIKEQVEALAEKFPVWVTDVATVEDAINMISDIGSITKKTESAQILSTEIKKLLLQWKQTIADRKKIKAAYLIWKDPYMTIGGDTFISNMLDLAGYRNVFADNLRYPEVSIEDLQESGCEKLFLSSEPYPFSEKHIAELSTLLPETSIHLVDGEIFSWYGSRMLKATEYFDKIA